MFAPEIPKRSFVRRQLERVRSVWLAVLYKLRLKRKPFSRYQMPIINHPYPPLRTSRLDTTQPNRNNPPRS